MVKKKVLFEDAMMGYNKWVSGIAAREFNSQRMKFKDLVSGNYDTDQSPNNAKADNVLPFQLTNAANILGDLFTNTSNAIAAFEQALQAPAVKKDEQVTEEVNQMINHLKDSLSCLKNILKIATKEKQVDPETSEDNE
jgi:hypothetical protein